MVNQDTLEGRWREISGQLREKWGQLTEDELEQAHGSTEQLIGYIQRKTGESREAVEKFLNEAAGPSGIGAYLQGARDAAKHAKETVVDAAGSAAAAVQHQAEDIGEAFSEGYHKAEELVQSRPAESLAVAFGAGVVVGVVVGLVASSRR